MVIKFIVRWIIALPAGLIAAMLVMFPVHWALEILYSTSGETLGLVSGKVGPDGEVARCGLTTCFISIETLERMIQALIVPYVTLAVVAKVVPHLKFFVVTVLCALYVLGVFAYFSWLISGGGQRIVGNTEYGYSGWEWIEAVVVIAGIAIVVMTTLKREYVNRSRGGANS
ncbi:hypothetical protein M1N56_05360 [Dehalococcoidia bacterium]|nr:hypothetical protein [Dehalococcoidia bacterium]